jgi:hypothetical protein
MTAAPGTKEIRFPEIETPGEIRVNVNVDLTKSYVVFLSEYPKIIYPIEFKIFLVDPDDEPIDADDIGIELTNSKGDPQQYSVKSSERGKYILIFVTGRPDTYKCKISYGGCILENGYHEFKVVKIHRSRDEVLVAIRNEDDFFIDGNCLNLGRKDIIDEDCRKLAPRLTTTQINTLYLHNNYVTHVGIVPMAEALIYNKFLSQLFLYKNNIGDEGCKALTIALKNQTVLTYLHVGANNITPVGVQYLVEALIDHKTFKTLYIYDNKIGDEGGSMLAELAQANEVLNYLHVAENGLSHDVEELLKAVWKERSTNLFLEMEKINI